MPRRDFEIKAIFKAIDRVTRPLSKMQRKVAKFTRKMRRGLKKVNVAAMAVTRALGRGLRVGAIAAAVGVAALGTAIIKITADLDQLAKQSKRLDFPIEDLQEWRFVAEQSGITADQFSKSLDKFTKTLGEAKQGYGTMVENLKRANPKLLKQLTLAKDVGAAFDIYIEAMRNAGSASERAALGATAFGRSGIKMSNIAKLSAEQIAKLRAEMQANGVATMEQAEAAERFNDSMNSLKNAVIGFFRGAVGPLIPDLEKLIDKLRGWVIENREIIKGKIVEFIGKARDKMAELVEWFKKFTAEGGGLEKIQAALALIGDAFDFIGTHKEAILGIVAAVAALVVVMNVLVGVLTLVNLVMAANPVVLIILGIAALIAILVVLWNKFEGFRNFWKSMWGWNVAIFETAIGLLFGPLIDLVLFVKDDLIGGWNGFPDAMKKIFGRVKDMIFNFVPNIMKKFEPITDFVSQLFGGSDKRVNVKVSGDAGGAGAQVVGPGERLAKSIEESTSVSRAEVTIKDESGRAELTAGELGQGVSLTPSGAF